MVLNKLEALLFHYGIDVEFLTYWRDAFNTEIELKSPVDDDNIILSTLEICFDLSEDQYTNIKKVIIDMQVNNE